MFSQLFFYLFILLFIGCVDDSKKMEIRTCGSLRHPNVVSYYTSFAVKDPIDNTDTLWVVMEYMECGEVFCLIPFILVEF